MKGNYYPQFLKLTLGVMLIVIPTLLGYKEMFTLPLPELTLGPVMWNTLPLNFHTKTHLSLFKR